MVIAAWDLPFVAVEKRVNLEGARRAKRGLVGPTVGLLGLTSHLDSSDLGVQPMGANRANEGLFSVRLPSVAQGGNTPRGEYSQWGLSSSQLSGVLIFHDWPYR